MTQNDLQLKEIELDLKIGKVTFGQEELSKALGEMLGEMRKKNQGLSQGDREILRRIMTHPDGSLSVQDLFPKFQRQSSEHNTLRLLRDSQFIRPENRRGWRADSKIEIKPFAELMWHKIGEQNLFAGPS